MKTPLTVSPPPIGQSKVVHCKKFGVGLWKKLLAVPRESACMSALTSRIDQKTCAKCVVAAGLEMVVIPLLLQGDQLCTDMECLREKVIELGSSQIVAVLSTTSCFAPRAADDLITIAKLCKQEDIGHVVNNAYGVQVLTFCYMVM